MDITQIAEGLELVKSSFDTFRAAIGLVRDVQSALPESEKKDVVARTLAEADKQVAVAEAQIAQALGYSLCRCQFPPTAMLKVGWASVPNPKGSAKGMIAVDLHECPKCRQTDVHVGRITRIIPRPGGT